MTSRPRSCWRGRSTSWRHGGLNAAEVTSPHAETRRAMAESEEMMRRGTARFASNAFRVPGNWLPQTIFPGPCRKP